MAMLFTLPGPEPSVWDQTCLHTHTLEDSTMFVFSFCRLKAFLDLLNTFFCCNLSWLSGCQETCQTLGHNSGTDMPRAESWHKVVYKVRYVKPRANSLVITWVS